MSSDKAEVGGSLVLFGGGDATIIGKTAQSQPGLSLCP